MSLTATGNPELFVTPQGASVAVFLQTQGLGPERRRLVKLLQNGGAHTSHGDPGLSSVILVKEDSDDGRNFIRIWGREPGKVVLRYQWIDACVKAGRMLAESDNWGGFIAQDDGEPLQDDAFAGMEPEHNYASSPLPTPRHTKSPDNRLPSVDGDTDVESIDEVVTNDIDPFHFLQALSDEMVSSTDTSLRRRGRRLQAVIPDLREPSEEPMDVDIPAPSKKVPMSDKARGKQRDNSELTTSRASSIINPRDSPSELVPPPSPSASLFMKKGRSVKFYVQADYYQRKDLVRSIRKHGGTIASHVKEADFAILYAKAVSRKEYQSSLASATADKIPAVGGKFIEDCITANKVLDHEPYAFVPPNKRKRSPSAQAQSSDDSESDIPLQQKSKLAKLEKSPSKSAKPVQDSPSPAQLSNRQVHAVFPASSSNRHPPKPGATIIEKPPPPKERVSYKYTPAEVKLALDLAYKCWEKDFNVSDSQVAKHLHSQMPHHTLASWTTQLNQTRKQQFDEVRKKAGIQYRKRKALEVNQQGAQSRASSMAAESQGSSSRRSSIPSIRQYTPPPPQSTPLPPRENQTVVQHAVPPPPVQLPPRQATHTVEQEIVIFADFLAFKGGDQFDPQDQTSAYQALAKLAPWRTADEWGAFWSAHHSRINPLYDQKIGRNQAPGPQSRDDIFGEGEVSLGDRLRNY